MDIQYAIKTYEMHIQYSRMKQDDVIAELEYWKHQETIAKAELSALEKQLEEENKNEVQV